MAIWSGSKRSTTYVMANAPGQASPVAFELIYAAADAA